MPEDLQPWRFVSGFASDVGVTPCPLHHHRAAEVVYHPSGAGTTTLGDGLTLAFGPGDAVIYAPFVRHWQRLVVAGRDCCLQVDWPAGVTSALPPVVVARGPLPEWVQRELTDLGRHQTASGPRSGLALDLRATAVGLALLDAAGDPDPTEAPSAAERQVEQAAAWISGHFASTGRIEEVADAIGVSYDSLRRDFRRLRGSSLIGWLTEVRMARAKELLTNTPLRQAEIAHQCGYTSARYLAMVFRRSTGMSPDEWRTRT